MADAATVKELTSLHAKLKKAADEEKGDAARASDLLTEIWSMDNYITVEMLRASDITTTLKKLKTHTDSNVATTATRIYNAWKSRFSGKSPTNAPSAGKDAGPSRAGSAPKAAGTERTASSSSASSPPESATAAKQGAPSASTVAKAAPAGEARIPTTGDKNRDKCRKDFADALGLVGTPDRADQIRVGCAIESAMFGEFGGFNKQYAAKYRSLLFNLKDDKNPELRKNVLYGHISADQLVKMSPQELASQEMKKHVEEIAKKKLEEVKPDWDQSTATTDQFKCGKCGKRETTYYQLQTRSADEPMTTFVTCVNCGNRWKC